MQIEDFLALLDNPDIQDKIKSIGVDKTKKDKKLKNENETLKSEVEEMGILIEKLKQIICGKEEELEKSNQNVGDLNLKLNNENSNLELLKKENLELEQKVKFYSDIFEDDLKYYDIFSKLNSNTKESLAGIFKNDTLEGFIACGIQEKNINNLWEYIKTEIVNNNDVEALVSIYYYLFKKFTLAFPVFEIQDINISDNFDNQEHIKHNSSKNSSGKIEKILLKGYINTKTSKVIKQSLVVV